MECPKCHKNISDDATVCPHCYKVLALECPNCHALNATPVCEKCGYIILVKCSKCSKMVPVTAEKCRCGFPVSSSIAYQECDSDEFASLVIRFSALKNIRKLLGSKDLYNKFYTKLRNLLTAQFKGLEGKIIAYDNSFVVNFNRELSLPTSANKAIRLALKIVNAFAALNANVIEEFSCPLKLNITIVKKTAEELLKETAAENNVKLLNIKKQGKKFLKGMQIILDQYIWDNVSKDYETDSLFSMEENGKTTMFYEILLDNYVLPPSGKNNEAPAAVKPSEIKKQAALAGDDVYAFKVFDINAKCKFEKVSAKDLIGALDDSKIISIRADKDLQINTGELVKYYTSKGLRVIRAFCSEETAYRPWGVFEQLFKDYYALSFDKSLIPSDFDVKHFKALTELFKGFPRKAAAPEDARFAYMEDFRNFLASLKNCVILIEGFENMDDTSIQTLELYFDRFKKVNVNFVFITDRETALHGRIKGLLRTPLYTEFMLVQTGLDSILADIKEDASDFISSFYFEKISENLAGSFLYYKNAIDYLTEKDILINFENKLLIKNNDSVILPNSLDGLLKARLKNLSKYNEASMILAFSSFLGARLDFKTLEKLGIKEAEKQAEILANSGFATINQGAVYINNYNFLKPVIQSSLKKPVQEFLCKTIFQALSAGLDTTAMLLIAGKLSKFKEEYALLQKNSTFAMAVGDFDAYLKNCLGFLSLIEYTDIPKEEIEGHKKEVFQNILMSLYSYSPEKIYSIENVLLMDAVNDNDNDNIAKLSNLMLQGALISSNYTDALNLLHNILTRMPHPTLLVDGAVNTRFLLLSLVNIEILFNIGDFAQCVDIAKDLLGVLQPEILEKIKPASFSTNLFVEHLFETLRLAAFAKLFLMDDDLDEFFNAIRSSLGEELPDKDALIAIREFLDGKEFAPSKIENASAFSKVIYLILQEFSEHSKDYKNFAQNIYQAKLLAADLHQKQLELFCDLLIAYSYANIGLTKKAASIYQDILEKSEKSAIFNILTLAKYFIARLKIVSGEVEEALLIINDTLALLQKYNNSAKIIYVMFEKLFLDTVKNAKITSVNIESEERKLALEISGGKLSRLVKQ